MYLRVSCGSGTEVTRMFHSAPSAAAACRPLSCSRSSGTKLMPRADKVMGSTKAMAIRVYSLLLRLRCQRRASCKPKPPPKPTSKMAMVLEVP